VHLLEVYHDKPKLVVDTSIPVWLAVVRLSSGGWALRLFVHNAKAAWAARPGQNLPGLAATTTTTTTMAAAAATTTTDNAGAAAGAAAPGTVDAWASSTLLVEQCVACVCLCLSPSLARVVRMLRRQRSTPRRRNRPPRLPHCHSQFFCAELRTRCSHL
jgi:hypothetical protein